MQSEYLQTPEGQKKYFNVKCQKPSNHLITQGFFCCLIHIKNVCIIQVWPALTSGSLIQIPSAQKGIAEPVTQEVRTQ